MPLARPKIASQTTRPMHLTNLDPADAKVRGFRHAPCFAPGSEFDARHPYVVIDHEEENEHLECIDGDEGRYQKALARAARIMLDVRERVPVHTKVGWYGWPYPRQDAHVLDFAERFRLLLAYADFIAPCCYIIDGFTPAQMIKRAHLIRRCIEAAIVDTVPVFPFIADLTLDGRRVCDDSDLHTQCQMARILGAKHVYVWSAMQYHTWAAKLDPSVNDTVIENVSRSRASLIGTYGFAIKEWTNRQIDKEQRRYTRGLLQRVKLAWRETE